MRVSRQKSQMKLVRMTAISIAAFLISWLPYTAVSIAALIRGRHVLTSGEAEIPELMAKASVIYNPFVYMFMNGAYRASFWELFSGNKEVRTNLHPTTNSAEGRVSSENSGTVNKSYEETALWLNIVDDYNQRNKTDTNYKVIDWILYRPCNWQTAMLFPKGVSYFKLELY